MNPRQTSPTRMSVRAGRLAMIALAVALVPACTWVQLTDGGAQVQVLAAPDVANCNEVGRTTSTTRDKVVINRGDTKVRAELQTLARNEAARMGGNAIVPEGEPDNGTQAFSVYAC